MRFFPRMRIQRPRSSRARRRGGNRGDRRTSGAQTRGAGGPMKALSIIQPWAWLIVHGHKPVENRRWPTSFRGQFLIHAGKKFDHEAIFWLREIANKSPVSGIDRIILPPTFARGCIIARAGLV